MMFLTCFIFWILATVNARQIEGYQGEIGQQEFECEFNGKVYTSGEKVEGVCIDLTCRYGRWVSNGAIDPCCRTCQVRDDPHFLTFDNLNFDFHGTCNYSITQRGTTHSPAFGVFGEFNVCPFGLQWSSCIDIITFKDNANTVITMTAANPSAISVNGAPANTVSAAITQAMSGATPHPVLVWRAGNCIYLLGTKRLLLQYCWPGWWRQLYIFAHPSLADKLYGLCGRFNYYKYDDFTHRDLSVSPYSLFQPNVFGESWMTKRQNNRSCLRQAVVRDVDSYDPQMQPFIDECRQILTDVEVQGQYAKTEQLEVQARFCGADLFAFANEVPNEVDVGGYIEAVKEMLQNTIAHDVNETDCEYQNCGRENRFLCAPRSTCNQPVPGECPGRECTCCQDWYEQALYEGTEGYEEAGYAEIEGYEAMEK